MSLNFERLENRLLLASSVTQKGSTLVVTYDAAGDADVVLTGGGAGAITVTNATTGNDGYTGIKSIKIVGGAGVDGITLNGINITGNVTADLKGGDDALAIIGATTIGGNVSIKAGAGDDSIFFDADDIGGDISIAKNVTVDLGDADDGTDLFRVLGNDADKVTINGGLTVKGKGGTQDIELDSLAIAKNLKIDLGNGNDAVDIATQANLIGVGVAVGGSASIKVGDGDDDVTFIGGAEGTFTVAKNLTVDLGNDDGNEGNDGDTFTARADTDATDVLTVGGNVSIKGKGGEQLLNIDGITVTKNVSISLGNGDDLVNVGQVGSPLGVEIGGNLSISLGDGDDVVVVERVAVAKSIKVNGGAGDDELTDTDLLSIEVGGSVKLTGIEDTNLPV